MPSWRSGRSLTSVAVMHTAGRQQAPRAAPAAERLRARRSCSWPASATRRTPRVRASVSGDKPILRAASAMADATTLPDLYRPRGWSTGPSTTRGAAPSTRPRRAGAWPPRLGRAEHRSPGSSPSYDVVGCVTAGAWWSRCRRTVGRGRGLRRPLRLRTPGQALRATRSAGSQQVPDRARDTRTSRGRGGLQREQGQWGQLDGWSAAGAAADRRLSA